MNERDNDIYLEIMSKPIGLTLVSNPIKIDRSTEIYLFIFYKPLKQAAQISESNLIKTDVSIKMIKTNGESYALINNLDFKSKNQVSQIWTDHKIYVRITNYKIKIKYAIFSLKFK